LKHSTDYSSEENRFLQDKYNITAWLYDLLDYPWERHYRHWRPGLVNDIRGTVLEAGVGTGRNLKYYHPSVKLTGIDLSTAMLKRAMKRGKSAVCDYNLHQEDATVMETMPSNHFDWLIATFLCCVMPDKLQPLAIEQFERVLKPGGRFRLLEMQYSKNPKDRKRQELLAPWVEKVFGARFDRDTLNHLQKSTKLKIINTYFLKKDIYLVIEGVCVE
jgi:demethylmenaquinone methyltransferase/2-methoxy-6-polyprenyl-1,4-benzoquinol methylase